MEDQWKKLHIHRRLESKKMEEVNLDTPGSKLTYQNSYCRVPSLTIRLIRRRAGEGVIEWDGNEDGERKESIEEHKANEAPYNNNTHCWKDGQNRVSRQRRSLRANKYA